MGEDPGHAGLNDYLPLRPKQYKLAEPNISVTIGVGFDGKEVELLSDSLASFVIYDHGGADVCPDNGLRYCQVCRSDCAGFEKEVVRRADQPLRYDI